MPLAEDVIVNAGAWEDALLFGGVDTSRSKPHDKVRLCRRTLPLILKCRVRRRARTKH